MPDEVEATRHPAGKRSDYRRTLTGTLYGKLAAILFALCLVLGVLYTGWMIDTSQLYLQEVTQKLNRNLANHLAAERILFNDGRINKAAAEETFRTLMAINRSIEIYLLDREGQVLAFSAAPGVVKRSRVSMEPIGQMLQGEPLPIYGDDPRHEGRTKVFSVTALRRGGGGQPVDPDGALDGYLYVVLVGEDYVSALQLFGESRILRASVWRIGLLITLALVATLLIVHWLTRRLTTLAHDMEAFRESGFSQAPTSVRRGSGDEIDALDVTFREMGHRIVEQIRRLRDVDRMRRDLVANVSHDLRTPVASVQGYLETLLLKGSALAPEDRKRYLEVALKHSQGLSAMIAELFELAKLDAREVDLLMEPFSLCELGQDVLQRFELSAAAKRIEIASDLNPTLPMVVADIRLIERVLVNLIENAIRHTPSGGRVSVDCESHDDTVQITVSDTGTGIAPEELAHIFERFHRKSSADDDGVQGAGLGLAISKRILDLHDSVLTVRSEPGTRTTFGFALRVVDHAGNP